MVLLKRGKSGIFSVWCLVFGAVSHNVGHRLAHRAFFKVESLASRWHDPEQGLTVR